MKQKGFIPIPIIIAITSFLIIIGGGVVLYETNQIHPFNNTVDNFFSSTSDAIYKLIWQSKFEKEMLEQEVKLSNIKRGQAETEAKEEMAKRKEEEIARAEAEQKAQQEAVKRSQAEAKAKQEEFEKKLKEQQLSEKEAEEKRMDTDNDGDGLTYRRELELGTSDWDTDSDGDEIKDGEDAHPAGGGRYIPQNFQWSYGGENWTWTYSIHEDWYEYYKNKPRTSQGLEYVTENDPFIKEIAKALKEGAQKEGYAVSLFITSFVQGLPYVQDAYTSFDEYPKYPIETFVERNGDCEDTSYLAASLVDASGYGSALVELPGHMAITIKAVSDFDGYYYDLDDGRYYFFETTGTGWELGDMPSEYIYQQAKIIRIWDGKIVNSYPQYKKPCYASSEFSGYYTDSNYYYSDSNCNNRVYCLSYEGFYYNYSTEKFYWDSNCSQIVVEGCYKSDTYPGYFYDDDVEYYHDSRCLNKAIICRYYSYDYYWDGYDFYWDGSCNQKVVTGCDKSIYHPGYFFDGLDYYSDYRCTQKADL